MGGTPSSSEPVGVAVGVPCELARALAGKNARVAERRSRRENGRSPAETRVSDRSSAEDVFGDDLSVSDGASDDAASSRGGATSVSRRWPSSMSRSSEPRSLLLESLGVLRGRSPVSRAFEIDISSAPAKPDAKLAAPEADRACPDRVDLPTLRRIFAMVASATGSQSGLASPSASPSRCSRRLASSASTEPSEPSDAARPSTRVAPSRVEESPAGSSAGRDPRDARCGDSGRRAGRASDAGSAARVAGEAGRSEPDWTSTTTSLGCVDMFRRARRARACVGGAVSAAAPRKGTRRGKETLVRFLVKALSRLTSEDLPRSIHLARCALVARRGPEKSLPLSAERGPHRRARSPP